MPRCRDLSYLRYALPILSVVTIVAGVCLSFRLNEPEWLNRSGALVAAFAAAAILVQIRAEANVDAEEISEPLRHEARLPIEDLALRLEAEKNRARRLQVRVSIAAFVVVSAILGELLHGFGDLFMRYVFGVSAGR